MRPPEDSVREITAYLRRSVSGSPDRLYEAATHLIEHGGKRLRPYMLIQTCQMLGGGMRDAMAAAGAVEMIHNFSLVHDDIMDNDETRHGVPTTHVKYGTPLAILAGDTLFSKAYRTLSESPLDPRTRADLVYRLSGACVDICEGQWMDIAMSMSDAVPQPSEYVAMIRKKTSALFEVSCSMGAVCAGADAQDVSNAASFGLNMGTAFQITDDLLGVVGDPAITKKPVGNDIREGKKSLPILMALEEAKPGDRDAILGVFGRRDAPAESADAAVRAIRRMGIEETVRNRAASYADAARRSLAKYDGVHRQNLESLLEFVVKRSL
ncbi:MAG: polyprenyl synthetase family protein [Thaumarchaeota archaeon]|nr:polyprenyl synthetase family protein [Nitrososphaerota archaeon]